MLARLDDEELLDLNDGRVGCCTSIPRSGSTARCSRVASGSCTRSRVCPSSCPITWSRRFAQPAEDHAGRPRRPHRGRRRRRGARPRDQGRAVTSRRDLDPGAVRLMVDFVRRRRRARLTPLRRWPTARRRRRAHHAQGCRRHAPSTRSTPDPTACPSAGLVLHPDIMGVRPLFDDLCRRLATHGFAVCAPEPFARAPVEVRGDADPSARMAYVTQLDDDLQIGDLEVAADYLVVHDDVREVAVLGLLHGRHAGAQGRGDGPVRPGGCVLRDDPGARRVGGSEDPPAARHRGRCVPDARHLRRQRQLHAGGRHRGAARRRGPTAPTARSSCTPTPTTASCTPRNVPRTAPTTPPTRGAARSAFLLPD